MSIETQITQANTHWEAWNNLGFTKRIQLLEQALSTLEDDQQALAKWQLTQITLHLAQTHILQGATGESNTLTCLGRGLFLCAVQSDFPEVAMIAQIFTALATGNTVIIFTGDKPAWLSVLHQAGVPEAVAQVTSTPLENAIQTDGFVGLAYCASETEIINTHRLLAAKAGLLVQLVAETDKNLSNLASEHYANRFITERSISNNTTAVGGNATLLEMGAD